MKYLLGTDIGTSGTKTILMDTQGNLLAQDLQEYGVLTPQPLFAEQWPDVWLTATQESISRVVEKAAVDPMQIAGLCISGLYGGSGIPLDEAMNPVRPCLIWMDRRAGEQSRWVQEHVSQDTLFEITQNGTDPYYGYTKIMWIRDNEPQNWAKTRLFLPPNSYVIYKLTGSIAIDYSSAGNLGGIFDMRRRTWSEPMLDALGIPLSMLPQNIVSSDTVVGALTKEAARTLGLWEGLPVCAGGVDCGVATFGLSAASDNNCVAAIGTSMCVAVVHEGSLQSRELISWPYVTEPKRLTYTFGGGCTSGALIRWFRDQFATEELAEEKAGGLNSYAALDAAAQAVPVGSDGLIALPYFMGERAPVWDTDARGTFFGLTLRHTKAHLYRACLEAVAFSMRETLEYLGITELDTVLLAGGVTKSSLWRQIFADVTGCTMCTPKLEVEATLGDVMLAGLGTGALTKDDLKLWKVDQQITKPNEENHRIYSALYQIYRDLYRNTRQEMHRLSQMHG